MCLLLPLSESQRELNVLIVTLSLSINTYYQSNKLLTSVVLSICPLIDEKYYCHNTAKICCGNHQPQISDFHSKLSQCYDINYHQ